MDNDEKLKVSLQLIHREYLNRNMDTNTLRFWVSSIIGEEKTFDDFRCTIAKMEEFKNYLYKKFREMYMERLHVDITATDFEEFKRYNAEKPIDLAVVHTYISRLPLFVEVYTKLIKDAFVAAKKDCNESFIQFYLEEIGEKNMFDVPTVTSWILMNMHVIEEGPSNADGVASRNCCDETFKLERENVRGINNQQIALFELVFNRPMYVQEYFKYIHNRGNTEEAIDWSSVLNVHERNYQKVSEIYNLYTTLKLDEYYYIRTYLYEVDSERFLTSIIDNIIDSHEYERNMKSSIFTKYVGMFSETLDESDLMYIFEKVQSIKLNVYEHDIVDILHQFKKETNIIVSHMFKIYTKVLERHPDVHEIEVTLARYRTEFAQGYQSLDTYLENTLMKSLEFHDIIKKSIKTIYEEDGHLEILPSIMFSMLHRTLETIEGNGMDNLDMIIRAAMA